MGPGDTWNRYTETPNFSVGVAKAQSNYSVYDHKTNTWAKENEIVSFGIGELDDNVDPYGEKGEKEISWFWSSPSELKCTTTKRKKVTVKLRMTAQQKYIQKVTGDSPPETYERKTKKIIPNKHKAHPLDFIELLAHSDGNNVTKDDMRFIYRKLKELQDQLYW
jgi:hypothetical protein